MGADCLPRFRVQTALHTYEASRFDQFRHPESSSEISSPCPKKELSVISHSSSIYRAKSFMENRAPLRQNGEFTPEGNTT
jgi:hypothetical protein